MAGAWLPTEPLRLVADGAMGVALRIEREKMRETEREKERERSSTADSGGVFRREEGRAVRPRLLECGSGRAALWCLLR